MAKKLSGPCAWNCGRKATTASTSCYSKTPILMCEDCLIQVIAMFKAHVYESERATRQIFICECWRPVLNIDFHIDVIRI